MKLSECILKNPKCITENDTKLSLVEKNIYEIDDLGSQRLQNLETLYLSNNCISNLDHIGQFPNLKSLSLTYNSISSMQALKSLQSLPYLENLRLEGNPIAYKYPQFRKILLSIVPSSVKNIDGVPITESERKEAEVLYQKQMSLIRMLYENDHLICVLKMIIAKQRIHKHMVSLGQCLMPEECELNVELIIKSQKVEWIEDWEVNSWFENQYVKNTSCVNPPLSDTFNKRDGEQPVNWDLKFSDYIIQQQTQIAQLKQQISDQIKSTMNQRSKQSGLSTPRIFHQSNQLFGIQSPRIIEKDKTKSPFSASVNNEMGQGLKVLQNNISIINGANNKRSGGGSTNSKKRKKKLNNSTDIKGMNLTKILEVKENSYNQDSNLLNDQTFSNLLLNDDTSNFEPLPNSSTALVNTVSPNTIINNKLPKQPPPAPQPLTQDLQFSLQILDRLEALEQQLKQRETQNEDLQSKNKLLIGKIKEFQEQNRINVESAKNEIVNLQRQLKEMIEARDNEQETRVKIESHLEFLEEENRVLNSRLIEIEDNQKQMEDYHQQLNEDIYEKGKLEVAQNMNNFHIKRRWFFIFRKSTQTSKKLNSYLHYKAQKKNHLLKLLCFLYFRQEAALNKHVRQLQYQKEQNLKYYVLQRFYLNKKLQQNYRIFKRRQDYRIQAFYFRGLFISKQIMEQKRKQKHNAYQVRQLLLKNKGFTGLKIHMKRLGQMPLSPMALQHYNKLIRQHRQRFYLNHMKHVCLKIIPQEKQMLKKAQNKYQRSLIGRCFNHVFKKMIKRKKEIKASIKHMRAQHALNLQVKALSALLFYKIDKQNRKPLQLLMCTFIKQRFLNKWVSALHHQRTMQAKLKFFKLRWLILKKKIYLRALQKQTLRQHILDKLYSVVRSKHRVRVFRVFVKKWITRVREALLEQRLIKYQVIKALKNMVHKSRAIRKKAIVMVKKKQLKTIAEVWKQWDEMRKRRIDERNKIMEFRQNHVERVMRSMFYKMISVCFTQFAKRQRDEINILQEQLEPLQTTFEEKQSQMNYFLNKCCELENENQELQSQCHQIQAQYEELQSKSELEIQSLHDQINNQAQICKELQSANQELDLRVQDLQALHLKKLEDYKQKFQKSEREIQKLHQLLQEKENQTTQNKEEHQNNIKLLHQLKKAHKTIDEMRKVIESAENQIIKLKKEIETEKKQQQVEREELMNKHISDIKDITFMVEKVKRENSDLKKEVAYLTDKLKPYKHQQNQQQQQQQTMMTKRVRFEGDVDQFPTRFNS